MTSFALNNEVSERRLQDAAHALFDAAISALPDSVENQSSSVRTSLALSLCVQSLFMADWTTPGAEIAKRTVNDASNEFPVRLHGLASGLGSCISMNSNRSAQFAYSLAVVQEIQSMIRTRNASGFGAKQ